MEMKQKYNLEIAGIQLSILSDESEDFVKELVAKLDTQITDLTVHNMPAVPREFYEKHHMPD